jgi:two-component system, OmpR family, response regulator
MVFGMPKCCSYPTRLSLSYMKLCCDYVRSVVLYPFFCIHVAIQTYLVEDNAIIRESIVALLSETTPLEVAGFAESETDAISLLEKNTCWQLVILDIFLKKGNGLNVAFVLRKRGQHQKLIVLSNYATEEIKQRCTELGVDAVFDKSTDIDRLIDYCCSLQTPLQQKPQLM